MSSWNSPEREASRAMGNAFWIWAGSDAPMSDAMAVWSLKDGLGEAASLPIYAGGALAADRCASRALEWARAVRGASGRPAAGDPKSMGKIAGAWAAAWGDMAGSRTTYVSKPAAGSWGEHGLKALSAAIELERALGMIPAATTDAEAVEALMAKAVAEYVRAPKKPAAIAVGAWIGMGASIEGRIMSRPGPKSWSGPEQSYSYMEACLLRPVGWLLASQFAAAGAKAGPQWHGHVRQAVNCALAEDGRSRGEATPAERAQACVHLLSAMGSDIVRYRGKGGERFDEFALGALWGNPCGEMVRELAKAGLRWSPRAKAKACAMAAKRLGASRDSAPAVLESLEALGPLGDAVPFGRAWVDLAKAAKAALDYHDWSKKDDSSLESWGSLFAGWGRASGWKGEDLAELAKAWPGLRQSRAFASWEESIAIGAAAQPTEHEPAPARPRFSL